MTVQEFLQVCRSDAYVGFWNMDYPANIERRSAKRYEIAPTPQTYSKIENLSYGRIGRYLSREVMNIDHTEKGFLVRFYDKERLKERSSQQNLAREIAKAIKEERP